jgi:hypothetical protein
VIDEGGPQALRERVTLTTVDRQEASLRSDGDVQGVGPVILNVDATPLISGLPSGKVRVRFGLDYLPSSTDAKQRGARTRLQLAVIVDDGKTLVASDTSDPDGPPRACRGNGDHLEITRRASRICHACSPVRTQFLPIRIANLGFSPAFCAGRFLPSAARV